MTEDSAYIIPPKQDAPVGDVENNVPMFEKFKELFKFLTPNNDLAPA